MLGSPFAPRILWFAFHHSHYRYYFWLRGLIRASNHQVQCLSVRRCLYFDLSCCVLLLLLPLSHLTLSCLVLSCLWHKKLCAACNFARLRLRAQPHQQQRPTAAAQKKQHKMKWNENDFAMCARTHTLRLANLLVGNNASHFCKCLFLPHWHIDTAHSVCSFVCLSGRAGGCVCMCVCA